MTALMSRNATAEKNNTFVFTDARRSRRHVSINVGSHHPCVPGFLFKKEVNQMKSQHVFSLLGNKLCVV